MARLCDLGRGCTIRPNWYQHHMNEARNEVLRKANNQLSAYFDTRDRVRWTSSLKRLTEDAAQEYEGRFLVELIQNGYDANPPDSTQGHIEVLLDLTEGTHGVLYVANTGRPFTYGNFDAITDIAQSDKPPGEGIGNKGVGFKSVLQVSEWPEVYSTATASSESFDGYCFRFAQPADVQRLLPDSDRAADVIRDVSPYLLPIPIDDTPPSVAAFRGRGFCTVIRLPLRSAKAATIGEQETRRLANSDAPILLFLDRISRLHLCVRQFDGTFPIDSDLERHHHLMKAATSDDRLSVAEVQLGDQGTYLVATRSVPQNELRAAIDESIREHQLDHRWTDWAHDAILEVAAKVDGMESGYRLYTFLPMENSPSPLPAHANAPFFTKLTRTTVSFSVPLNEYLLNEFARLCVDAAFWFRGADERYAPICLDLISWDQSYVDRLTSAFEAKGLRLESAELVPINPRRYRRFATVSEARRWDTYNPPLGVVTIDRLTRDADAVLLDPSNAIRAERFSALQRALGRGDGRPTMVERAEWCEQLAQHMHHRKRAGPETWIAFYEDLAVIFKSSADSLQGRRLILDNKGGLQPCLSAADERSGPVMFFWPVQSRTEGEEDVETSLDLTPPRALSRHIGFTDQKLDWYVQEGSRRRARACRQFLETNGLVRRYRTEDVLEALRDLLQSRQTEEVLRQALLFVYRLRDRTSGKPALMDLGLHVPLQDGKWVPAPRALFSDRWPETHGTELHQLIQITGAISPSMSAMEAAFIQAPERWLPARSKVIEWTRFLKRLGVRDGLWPVAIGPNPFRQYGAGFTPYAWSRAAGLAAEPNEQWIKDSPRPRGFLDHPQTTYVSTGPLWVLPGQFEHSAFSDTACREYAALTAANLGAWSDAGCLSVDVRRENHPGDSPTAWPTPVATFLRHAPWMPVETLGQPELSTTTLSRAWFFNDARSDTLPLFAPLVPRQLRRALETDGTALQLLRSYGMHSWNDPLDAPALLHFLYDLLRDGQVPAAQLPFFRRHYEQAVHDSLTNKADVWVDGADIDLVVQRGERLEPWSSTGTRDLVYIDDGADSATARIVEDLGVPIACSRHGDATDLARTLAELLPGRTLPLWDLAVEVAVDGVVLSELTPSIPLVAEGREWLVELVVAAVEYHSSQPRRPPERRLREAARQLRDTVVVPASQLTISVNGQPVGQSTSVRDALATVAGARPVIVLEGFPGEFTFPVLERMGPALAQVLGAPELGYILFMAFVLLGRSQASSAATPPEDAIADALRISVSQLHEAIQLLQSPLEHLALRLQVAVACRRSPSVALGALSSLTSASSEEQQVAVLRELGMDEADELLAIAKQAVTLGALREELGVGYREFNAALKEIGLPPLEDAAAQDQAFAFFIAAHRDTIAARLRAAFLLAFESGTDLAEYVNLRLLPELGCSPTWLVECEVPTDEMMTKQVDAWLCGVGASPLGSAADEATVDAVRARNRRVVTTVGELGGRLVRAWCSKHAVAVPNLWGTVGSGSRLADLADEHGLLDFVALETLKPLLPYLRRLGAWPAGMPITLEPSDLGLTEADLSEAETEEERLGRQRDLERRSIAVGGSLMAVEPDRFPEIADAVRRFLSPDLLKTPLRMARLSEVAGRNGLSGGQSGPRSVYRGGSRPTDQQLAAIGLVGEVIALDWLTEQYRGGVVTWRSGYRDKVLGGAIGDDTLGYDIEAVTPASTFLFEVKSSIDEGREFELTEAEVNAARRHAGRGAYRIVYVRHVLDPERTSILLLPNPFTRLGQQYYRIVGGGLHYRFSID